MDSNDNERRRPRTSPVKACLNLFKGSSPLCWRGSSERNQPVLPPPTAAPPKQTSGPLLLNVTVCAIGLQPREVATIYETVPAFGGQVTYSPPHATHAIVPDVLPVEEWERLRTAIEERLSAATVVVSFAWLQSLLSSERSPWDKEFTAQYVPMFVQAVAAELGSSVLGQQKRPRVFEPAASIEPLSMNRTAFQGGGGFEAGAGNVDARPTSRLEDSLRETWEFMKRERPADLEESEIQYAIQRSLMDKAVEIHGGARNKEATQLMDAPEQVLGINKGASVSEVRAAYREKARRAHPDKGGDPKEFCRIQKAYLALSSKLEPGRGGSVTPPRHGSGEDTEQRALTMDTPAKDVELRDHKALVRQKFEEDGVDLSACVARQHRVMEELGIQVRDVGSTNENERGQKMHNQCFYLSLACSLLGSASKDEAGLKDTALLLKRTIESGVLTAHPDWSGNRVGEDVQAFSDFLFYVLGTHTMLSEYSVAVFDATSGGVEIYKGRAFPGGGERDEEQRSNLLTVMYVPGHYQALVTSDRRPSLTELQVCLEAYTVMYVTTCV